MALNSGGVLTEPAAMVLYNDPLLICEEDNQNACSLVFKTINSDMIANSTLIFDPNIYQIGSELTDNFSPESGFNIGEGISFRFENEAIHTDNNLNMVQYLYENPPKDQPEFVDVNNLTGFEYVESKNFAQDSFVVSDDENDVIFVKEYRKEESKEDTIFLDKKDDTKEEGIRRNPVRKVRTNKGRRHLEKEHLLEEDFAFLDQIDEDNLIFSKSKSSSSTTSANSSANETFKEWPINCYERPEYNPHTNKIEPLDYTIREIQCNQNKKKQRLETCTTKKKKPKKKYFIRKRKPKAKKAEKKIPVNELKEVVRSTLDLVGDFVQTLADNDIDSEKTVCNDGLYNLIKNQTMLMAIIYNYDEKEITKCASKLLGDR